MRALALPVKPRVVLDTSVLFESTKRDLLLELAEAGVYEPFWSTGVLDELAHEDARFRRRGGAGAKEAAAGATRLVGAIRESFRGSERAYRRDMSRTRFTIEGHEFVVDPLRLPDGADAHVIAAAADTRAHAIVADDGHGFPEQDLPPGTRRFSSAAFAAWIARTAESELRGAVRTVTGHTRITTHELLDKLDRVYEWHDAVESLRTSRRIPKTDAATSARQSTLRYGPTHRSVSGQAARQEGIER